MAKVGIVMGSDSDMPVMRKAAEILLRSLDEEQKEKEDFGIVRIPCRMIERASVDAI